MPDAEMDPLTQVLRPKTGTEQLRQTFHAAQAAGRNLALLYVDIDHFKRFNAHNGHALGDQVLAQLAMLLQATLSARKHILFRIAGDEFVILLPTAAATEAETVAASICAITAQHLTPPQAAHCGDKNCHGPTTLSVSIGIACMEMDTPNHLTLLHQAEEKMFLAKQAGRACFAR